MGTTSRRAFLSLVALLLAVTWGLGAAPEKHGAGPHTLTELTAAERLAYLRRAQVWHQVDIPSMDVRRGPKMHGALAPMEDVTCRFQDKKIGGTTPKFICVIPPADEAKVRYRLTNGKVYAAVTASRLAWALGFATDADYPVRVTCLDCPSDPWAAKEPRLPQVIFERAVIERHPDMEMAVAGKESQWSFDELALVDPAQGGATRAQIDALKLFAVFIQLTDNKAINQHLDCSRDAVEKDAAGNKTCTKPLLALHDVGNTFGKGTLFGARTTGSANYEEWSQVPLWKDPVRCQGQLGANITHPTLKDPLISEAGRRFLAGLLAQLSDDQIRGLFEVGDMANRQWENPDDRERNGTIDQWVAVFHARRDAVVNHTCP